MALNCVLTGIQFFQEVNRRKKNFRDLRKDKGRLDSIVKKIHDCSNLEFHELHKSENNVKGNLVFRAKREGIHFVYAVSKKKVENLLF